MSDEEWGWWASIGPWGMYWFSMREFHLRKRRTA
jgi:hypothetical protein